MSNRQKLFQSAILIVSTIILSACGSGTPSSNKVEFSNDDQTVEKITPYIDQLADKQIIISETKTLNQEFTVQYKTYNPDGIGKATFKAKSFKAIDKVGNLTPDEGKKLYVLELAVKGYQTNKGSPSTFNQTGDNPSPQFVLIDKQNNKSFVEATEYSEAYNITKNYFALDKLTLDGDQTVNTAIVFQIDKNLSPDLAFRFINSKGEIEFYDLSE